MSLGFMVLTLLAGCGLDLFGGVDGGKQPLSADRDGDGYPLETDCNDNEPSIHPDAEEVCDGLDNNCTGEADEGLLTTWYVDSDGDGWGGSKTQEACQQPGGYTAKPGDCKDGDAAINPDAVEVCDGVDNDCDGTADVDADDAGVYYDDMDGDGWGDDEAPIFACEQPSGTLTQGGDCDDGDKAINPDAVEVCDSLDNDCDGLADDADDDVEGTEVWPDGDGDTFGDSGAASVWLCDVGDHVDNALDCDDGDPAVNPDGTELCDGEDTNCDGESETMVPGDYSTISGAIAAASMGDQICVEAGTYTEDIDFGGLDLEIIGVDGSGWTDIVGTGTDSVVTFSSGSSSATLLEGFTISGGVATAGGGIYAVNSHPILRDLVVVDNEASGGSDSHGGGIYLSSSDAQLENVDIVGNSAPGGYYCRGGGLYASYSDVVLRNVRVLGNTLDGDYCYGAGIAGLYGTLDLENVVIAGNEVTDALYSYGGGVFLYNATSATLTNVTIYGNEGAYRGGGIYLFPSAVADLVNVDITNNGATDNGGAVGVTSGGTFTFSYCNLDDNRPDGLHNVDDPVGTDGNVSVDPDYVDVTGSDPTAWDLTLQSTSGLIDAGDASIVDPDGTTSDIGAYGGPGAVDW